MPRRRIIRTEKYPYHIVIRSNNREHFYLPMETIWKIFCDFSYLTSILYRTNFQAVVLMSNHFHFIISTPLKNIDDVMNYLVRELAKEINRRAGRINRVFGGRYKWSLIQDPKYYFHAFKYVYRNPVKANLVTKVEEYRFSSLFQILGSAKLVLPLSPPPNNIDRLIPKSFQGLLTWLNHSYSLEESESIRKSLRKNILTPPKQIKKELRLFWKNKIEGKPKTEEKATGHKK